MAKREILASSTDQTIDVFINDSSSTTGAGLTGLAYNTASLTCYYRKGATGTPTALTLATQTVGGAHSDGGFVAVDGTNCPGQYRLDLSDTIVATAGMVTIYLGGAANMVPCVTEIEVVSVNKFDSVRMGLTALPNAAAEAAGGLYTRGTGAGQINQATNGQIDANAVRLSNDAQSLADLKDFADDGYDPSTHKVQGVVTADALTANNDKTGYSVSGTITTLDALSTHGDSTWATATGFSTHSAADVWSVATRILTAATNITSTGGTTVPQTGDSYTRLGAPAGASVSADVAAVKTDTGNLVTRITSTLFSGITSLANWLGALAGKTADSSTQTEIRATTAGAGYTITTDSLEALRDRGDAAWITATGFAVAGDAMTLGTDAITAASVSAAAANKLADHTLRRTMANVEASSNGDTLSLGCFYGLVQMAQESSISGSTMSVYRTDGSTSLGTKTVTTDDTADPIVSVS